MDEIQKITEIWDTILHKVRDDFDVSDVVFRTFLKDLVPYSIKDGVLYILIPEDQSMGTGYYEKRYVKQFFVAITELTRKEYDIKFIDENQAEALSFKRSFTQSTVSADDELFINANLLPQYSFETFVVGSNNRLAHAASVAVAESPGETYNPLFIYGGVGLGKTHLMHSIGHFVLEQNPDKKVLYVTSEEFTNEVVEAIRSGNASSMTKIREKYRTVDVLLIDDIQFIIGKEATQEEFFHTFNALQTQRKAIILTSDRPPREMETLEDRFRSRFEMGLMVDIQAPDYETRMAILRKKAEKDNFEISDEILQYIAENIKSNIRELEGALNKLYFSYKMAPQENELTLDFAKEELTSIINPDEKKTVTPELIIDVVCEHFHIDHDMLTSKSRSNDVVKPRQIAMYLCKNMTGASLDYIGELLGGRDHSTVMHGVKSITADYENKDSVKNTINAIKKKINPN